MARNHGGEHLYRSLTRVRRGAKPSASHIPRNRHRYRRITVARKPGHLPASVSRHSKVRTFAPRSINHMNDSDPLSPRMFRQPMLTRPHVQLGPVGHPMGGDAAGPGRERGAANRQRHERRGNGDETRGAPKSPQSPTPAPPAVSQMQERMGRGHLEGQAAPHLRKLAAPPERESQRSMAAAKRRCGDRR